MNEIIHLSVEAFVEMITALTNLKSLERYVNATECRIDRGKIAAICGFELKEVNGNADV